MNISEQTQEIAESVINASNDESLQAEIETTFTVGHAADGF